MSVVMFLWTQLVVTIDLFRVFLKVTILMLYCFKSIFHFSQCTLFKISIQNSRCLKYQCRYAKNICVVFRNFIIVALARRSQMFFFHRLFSAYIETTTLHFKFHVDFMSQPPSQNICGCQCLTYRQCII